MRILYLSLSYVPSRRASSVQVMRMCEAFATLGHEVTLVAKRGSEAGVASPYSFYGVTPSFEVVPIARPSGRGGGLLFAARTLQRVLADRSSVDLVYSRDLIGGVIASELGMPTVFELHGLFDRAWQRALWRRMTRAQSFRGLIAISHAMVRELRGAGMTAGAGPIVVAHSPASALPEHAPRPGVSSPPRVGYVGSLYPGRGVELVARLASRMSGIQFELVGGTEADLAHWRETGLPANVALRGFVAPRELPNVYRELDVLLMPYPHSGVHGATRRLDTARYCSPMKMFEYMASGVPMVASDLPVLQEVLTHERNALIAPADDDAAWQHSIERLINDTALRVQLGEQALADLVQFTPVARAKRVLRELGLSSVAPQRS